MASYSIIGYKRKENLMLLSLETLEITYQNPVVPCVVFAAEGLNMLQ